MSLVKYSLGLCTFFQQDQEATQLGNREASSRQSLAAVTGWGEHSCNSVPKDARQGWGRTGYNDPVAGHRSPATRARAHVCSGAGGKDIKDASGAF